MSRRAATGADTTAGVKTIGAIAFVLAMSIVVLLLVNARPSPDPFDPRSGRPDGARGLVLTLESSGADVTVARDLDEAAGRRILVLDDRLDDVQRIELLDAVEAGAIAVVADPASTLHGGSDIAGGAEPIAGGSLAFDRRLAAEIEANLRPGDCTIGALADVRGLVVPDGVLFPVGPDEPRCFTGAGPAANPGAVTSFVVVRTLGDGLIIGLGDNEPFQNRWLRGADNAALIVGLLAPERGADVMILLGTGATRTIDDVGTGDDSLRDLVPNWAWMAMILGAVAFVVFAASRATRLGRVLDEPMTTPIDGNELVAATGNLMERAGHAAQAAWLLQHRLHRDLCAVHRVPLDAPLERLDQVVADRTDTAPGEVARVLRLTATGNERLVAIGGEVRRLRALALAESGAATPDATSSHSDDADIHTDGNEATDASSPNDRPTDRTPHQEVLSP